MFIKGIKRNYDKINADESIADEDKIDALLKALGKDYLVSSEDRVYVFQKDDLTVKFDAKQTATNFLPLHYYLLLQLRSWRRGLSQQIPGSRERGSAEPL